MARRNWVIVDERITESWEEVFNEFLKMKKLNGLTERTLYGLTMGAPRGIIS
jgi:hypothetical protein